MTLPSLATAERMSFAGHETFPLRYPWLCKAVQGIASDPQMFRRDDAMVRLGVGKNMVRAIHHWGMVCGVIDEDPNVPNNRGRFLRPTEFGARLLGDRGWDPYLEDPASLWLVHFELASSPDRATTWYWVFNHLPQPEFAKAELMAWLTKLVHERGKSRVSPASLKRDIDVFLRMYVPSRMSRTVPLEDTLDSPLVELGLIREFGSRGSYLLQRGDRPTLPDAVFAYALQRWLADQDLTSSAVPLQSLAFAPGSPARVFALTEDALMSRLERLEAVTEGVMVFQDTAGLRQVLVHEQPSPFRVLDRHFAQKAPSWRQS